MIFHLFKKARRKREGASGAQAPNDFENNGAASEALIRLIVLHCFKKIPPPNLQVLPTALVQGAFKLPEFTKEKAIGIGGIES